MIVVVLGVVDIIAGFLTLFETDVVFGVFLYLGIFMLLKGLLSLITSMMKGYFLSWMGWVDIAIGITLLTPWNIPYIWVLAILKGGYSVFMGYLK